MKKSKFRKNQNNLMEEKIKITMMKMNSKMKKAILNHKRKQLKKNKKFNNKSKKMTKSMIIWMMRMEFNLKILKMVMKKKT